MNVAILFGRKNSKSIKNKNILKVFSKQMFMYPIDAAKKVREIDKIYVSSDSKFIFMDTSPFEDKYYTEEKYKNVHGQDTTAQLVWLNKVLDSTA